MEELTHKTWSACEHSQARLTRLRGVSYLVPASSQGLNYYLVSEYRAKNWSFESPSNTVISVDMSIVLIEVHLNVKL